MNVRIASPLLAASLSAVLLSIAPLRACNSRRSAAPPTVKISPLDATHWMVYAPGYQTDVLPLGVHFCAVGLAVPASGVITDVEAVQLLTESDASSIRHFSWRKSTAIAASFNRVQAGTWFGFLGEAVGPDAGGVNDMIALQVVVKSGTTATQLEADLKLATLGTDRATTGGDLLDSGRFLLAPTSVTVDGTYRNEKTLHNRAHSSGATRASQTAEDTLYFMQPIEFRNGQGVATGWRVSLQDEDASTGEVVQLGYVKYAGTKPDTTPSGLLTNVAFTVFGAGTGRQALRYTLTTAQGIPAGQISGLRLVLAKPRAWPTDAVTVATQDGASLKLPTALRGTWTWVDSTSGAQAFGAAGTTLDFGGLYDCSTLQVFNRSTAYTTPAEDLLGPEALYPDSTRGDQVGFQVESMHFAGQWALVFLAPDYLPTPLPTPFKDILIQNFNLAGFPFPLNAQGKGQTPAVPMPSKLSFALQAILFRVQSTQITEASLTDAAKVQVQ